MLSSPAMRPPDPAEAAAGLQAYALMVRALVRDAGAQRLEGLQRYVVGARRLLGQPALEAAAARQAGDLEAALAGLRAFGERAPGFVRLDARVRLRAALERIYGEPEAPEALTETARKMERLAEHLAADDPAWLAWHTTITRLWRETLLGDVR